MFEKGDLVRIKEAQLTGVVLSTETVPEEADVLDKEFTVVEVYRVSPLSNTAEIEWFLEENLEKIHAEV